MPDLALPSIFVGAFIGLLVGTPTMLTMGLAAHRELTKRRWVRGWIYALSGAAAGVLLALAAGVLGLLDFFTSDMHPNAPAPTRIKTALLISPAGGLFGASCAFAFWLIRRPDRDQASPASGNETSA
jgi:multisubunit Na+/H+ antiporter MnhB subunit